MVKVKYLGLDFGSSNTAVVARAENDKGERFYISFSDKQKSSFPTVMGRGRDGEYYYFSNAVNKIQDQKSGQEETITPVTDLKEAFGDAEGFESGKRFLQAVAEAIGKVKDLHGLPYDFSELEGIGFGMPAYFDEREQRTYRENMRSVLSEAFGIEEDRIVGCAEPELAAVAYNAGHSGLTSQKKRKGDGLLVLDFGGYTLDVAMMEFVEDRSTRKLTLQSCQCGSFPTKSYLSMGKQITFHICQEIYGERKFDYEVEKGKCALFKGDNYDQIEAGIDTEPLLLKNGKHLGLRYRYDGTEQAHSELIRVGMVPGVSDIAALNLEKICDNLSICILGYLERESSNAPSGGFKTVLFTGGASGMKPLRQKIIEAMEERYKSKPTMLWMDAPDDGTLSIRRAAEETTSDKVSSGNAVALGACLVAEGSNEYLTVRETSHRGGDTKLRQENNVIKQLLSRALNRLSFDQKSDILEDIKRCRIKGIIKGIKKRI